MSGAAVSSIGGCLNPNVLHLVLLLVVLLLLLQEVYSTLEQLVDRMAVRAGHASLIYESTAKNLGKLLSCMVRSRQDTCMLGPSAVLCWYTACQGLSYYGASCWAS